MQLTIEVATCECCRYFQIAMQFEGSARVGRGGAAERELLQALASEKTAGRVHTRPLEGIEADFVVSRQDGSPHQLIELKTRLSAARELQAAIAQLAIYAGQLPELEHAWLLIAETRLTPARLDHEWQSLRGVMRPEIAGKLVGIALTASSVWRSDPEVRNAAIDRWIGHRVKGRDAGDREPPIRVHPAMPTAKFFEVWKVLLSAWLRREGPLPVYTVAERAGAAHPTVAAALRRLEHRGEVRRRSDRSVELRRWPHRTYEELEPLLPALRKTAWFVDGTGRAPDPSRLLRRFQQKVAAPHVAVGGIEAARHLDPSLDLVGTPRVDFVVHVAQGPADFDFLRKLDPALTPTDTETGALVAVHVLTRQQALFGESNDGLRLADPAEVALDLAELRLTSQLHEFVQRLGGKE